MKHKASPNSARLRKRISKPERTFVVLRPLPKPVPKKWQRLSVKQLAAALPYPPGKPPRTAGYVWAMVRAGFLMKNKRTTLTRALRWMEKNPKFSWRNVYLKRLRRWRTIK